MEAVMVEDLAVDETADRAAALSIAAGGTVRIVCAAERRMGADIVAEQKSAGGGR